MRKIRARVIFLLLSAPCLAAVPSLPQSKNANQEFVLDANKPFVYVRFDHIGPGVPRSEDEPKMRIWLRMINNCRVPIVIFANGVPDESPKDEVGLRYEIVANPKMYGVAIVLRKPTGEKDETDTDDNSGAERMPRNDLVDVMSSISVDPAEAILFSMPVNHVSKHWHVEIPFRFDLPSGKGSRDEKNGGEPVMKLYYGLYDLPPQAQKQIPTN